jgi:hypothetical protein
MITSYNGKAEIERLGAKCFDVGVFVSALQRERRNGFVIAILCVPNEDLKFKDNQSINHLHTL